MRAIMDEPNYKVIELEAENDKLKDEIIKMLKEKINGLEKELAEYVEIGVRTHIEERDPGSHMIDNSPRHVYRTMSEVATALEHQSLLNASKLREEKEGTNNA